MTKKQSAILIWILAGLTLLTSLASCTKPPLEEEIKIELEDGFCQVKIVTDIYEIVQTNLTETVEFTDPFTGVRTYEHHNVGRYEVGQKVKNCN